MLGHCREVAYLCNSEGCLSIISSALSKIILFSLLHLSHSIKNYPVSTMNNIIPGPPPPPPGGYPPLRPLPPQPPSALGGPPPPPPPGGYPPLSLSPLSSRAPSNPPYNSTLNFEPHEISGPLKFYMGRRHITATSSDRIDPNRTVYRLKIHKPSIFDYISNPTIRSIIQYLVGFFPSVKAIYPEWFLPSTVILKKRKLDWDDEFETEKRIYHHLKPLQGTFIPKFYGEAIYDGSPALVLSKICGQRLHDIDFDTRPEADDPIFEAKVEEAFKALTEYGVIHGDSELHNIFEVEGRVMIIDFEQAELGSKIWEGSTNKGNVGYLMREFQRARGGTEFILAECERVMKESIEQAKCKSQDDLYVEICAD